MPAFLVVIADISNREMFIECYAKPAAELLARKGGRYLVRAPGAKLLEGRTGDNASIVISQWPDREAALAFWNSPEYAELKALRKDLADVQVLLIEAAIPPA